MTKGGTVGILVQEHVVCTDKAHSLGVCQGGCQFTRGYVLSLERGGEKEMERTGPMHLPVAAEVLRARFFKDPGPGAPSCYEKERGEERE